MKAAIDAPVVRHGGVRHALERLVTLGKALLPEGIPLVDEIWITRHRALSAVLALHLVGLPIYGVLAGYNLVHSILEGSLLVIPTVVAYQKALSRAVRMAAVTLGLVTSSAIMVHLSGGLIEAHFHFFVMVAVITLYQAWLPFLLAIGYVVLHHGVMGAIDPSSVFNHPAALAHPWKWATVHGIFISAASAAGLAAWRLNEDAQKRVASSFDRQLKREQLHLQEQARAQQAVLESEERFRSLVQNSYDIVTVIGPEMTVDYVSPSVERVLGYKPEDLLGTTGGQLTHEEDQETAAETFAQVLREPDEFGEFVIRARHADGSWKWLEITLHNLLSNPAINGVVAHQRDITDRKEAEAASEWLEEQLRQSQKLEAIGQLAGGVAHDFNNLLSVIQNFARFVYDELDADDARRQDVAEILGAGDRASNLVRQLLTFSRKDLIRPEVWDLNDIVSEMTKLLSRTIPENVEVHLDLDENDVLVNVDKGQMEQVIMNMAVNARDAMPAGGCMTVATSHLEVMDGEGSPLPPGKYAHLSMGDDGVGMDAATMARVFEPFFTTKSRDAGTGLGLATVYGIVQHAGGRVFVQSKPGKGTIFDVYLPLALQVPEDKLPSARSVEEIGGAETILVAEDEQRVRTVIERILGSKGYRVLSAPSGPEALELARNHEGRIDLLLTDLVMPHMSGPELAAALSDVKAIFMSGYSGDVIAKHGVPSVESYLEKPFSPESLLGKVREALDSKTPPISSSVS